MRSEWGIRISFQAVRKALNTLAADEVLVHEPGGYTLSKHWLLSGHQLFGDLLANSSASRSNLLRLGLQDKGFASFSVGSLYECDNLWGEVLAYVCRTQGYKGTIVGVAHYAWWMLMNLGKETRIFQELLEKGMSVRHYFLRAAPLNRWAEGIYQDIGVETLVTPAEAKLVSEAHAFNIVGDSIIQIEHDRSAIESIKAVFAKYRRLDQVPSGILTKLAHGKRHLGIKVTRNGVLAQALRKQFEERNNW
jgi:hypothetical protein